MSFVGEAQIVASLLLLWNRTALPGALLRPIAANVLVIDLTYIRTLPSFIWCLLYYIGLVGLIFWHYRDRMYAAYYALTQGLSLALGILGGRIAFASNCSRS